MVKRKGEHGSVHLITAACLTELPLELVKRGVRCANPGKSQPANLFSFATLYIAEAGVLQRVWTGTS
jgi:hypothetical protein